MWSDQGTASSHLSVLSSITFTQQARMVLINVQKLDRNMPDQFLDTVIHYLLL